MIFEYKTLGSRPLKVIDLKEIGIGNLVVYNCNSNIANVFLLEF